MEQRCGKCKACLTVEKAKSTFLKVANPPFSHADDNTVMLWNDTLDNNPCETWDNTEVIKKRLEREWLDAKNKAMFRLQYCRKRGLDPVQDRRYVELYNTETAAWLLYNTCLQDTGE